MSKFNVGDKVRPTKRLGCDAQQLIDDGGYLIITEISGSRVYFDAYDRDGAQEYSHHHCYPEGTLELVGPGKPRRTFKLVRDTPTMKKGALLQEDCDDGTQPYSMLNTETHCKDPSYKVSIAKRDLVEEQPNWFIEVFKVTPEYMTQVELDQFEAFKKSSEKPKKVKKAVTKK